jgi:NTE family protein
MSSDLLNVLRATPDFQELDNGVLQQLAAGALLEALAPDQEVYGEACLAPGLFSVVEGLVDVTHRSLSRRTAARLTAGPGQLFAVDVLSGAPMSSARARSAATVLLLPLPLLQRVRQTAPALDAMLTRALNLHQDLPWLITCLRRTPILRHVPPRLLYDLLAGARVERVDRLTTVQWAGEPMIGLTIVQQGELFLRGPNGGGTFRLVDRGAVVVDLELLSGRVASVDIVTGSRRCCLVIVDTSRFYALMDRSAEFRRGVLASEYGNSTQRTSLLVRAHGGENTPLNLVHVTGDQPGPALSQAIGWLAEVNRRDFDDRVVIVTLDRDAPAVADVQGAGSGNQEVVRVRLRPQGGPDEQGKLRTRLGRAHLVLLDDSRVGADEASPWVDAANATAWLSTVPWAPPPHALRCRHHHTVVYATLVPGGQPDSQQMARAAVRLSRDVLTEAGSRTALTALPPACVEQVERWARAISHRRVGLALSGGGALGFAHIALIRAIQTAGLPIDLIAGTSIGALIGAYTCVGGAAALDQLIAHVPQLTRALQATMISSRALSRHITRELGPALLQDLPLPLYPTAVDIDTAFEVTLRTGPVADAVRAAGTLPGASGPTVLFDGGVRRRLVDGGVLNNIPDDAAFQAGAQVVLAANCLAQPQPQHPRVTQADSRRGRALRGMPRGLATAIEELVSQDRLSDVLRASNLLMHQPTDWVARTADVRFQAADSVYSPLDWAQAARIVEWHEKGAGREAIDQAVEELDAALTATQWRGTQRPQPGGAADATVSLLLPDTIDTSHISTEPMAMSVVLEPEPLRYLERLLLRRK